MGRGIHEVVRLSGQLHQPRYRGSDKAVSVPNTQTTGLTATQVQKSIVNQAVKAINAGILRELGHQGSSQKTTLPMVHVAQAGVYEASFNTETQRGSVTLKAEGVTLELPAIRLNRNVQHAMAHRPGTGRTSIQPVICVFPQ